MYRSSPPPEICNTPQQRENQGFLLGESAHQEKTSGPVGPREEGEGLHTCRDPLPINREGVRGLLRRGWQEATLDQVGEVAPQQFVGHGSRRWGQRRLITQEAVGVGTLVYGHVPRLRPVLPEMRHQCAERVRLS